jgi:hypothetical protein
MKTKLLALVLLAATAIPAFSGVLVGVGYARFPVGYYVAPPPPPPVAYAAPAPYPAPGYTWVAGYYYPVGPRYVWHAGYWARPPFARAYWVAPRYYGHRYYSGYWRR